MANEDKQDELTEDEKDMIREMPLSVKNTEYIADEIKRNVDSVKTAVGDLEQKLKNLRLGQYRGTSRPFLYVLVATGIAVGAITGDFSEENNQLLRALKPQVQTANVIEGSAPEKFYEIGGQRAYLEIDGKPVAEYAKGRQ